MNQAKQFLQLETRLFFVSAGGEGSHTSAVVRGWENMRREVCKQLWFGTYEEAQKDEMIAAILEEIENVEDCWSDGYKVYYCSLEQAWIGVQVVDEIKFYHDMDREVNS